MRTPDKVFRGVVQDISRVLDPTTRSAKVRVVLRNPDSSLRPGMFAIATFRSRRMRSRLVVPASAIMRLQDPGLDIPEGRRSAVPARRSAHPGRSRRWNGAG